MSANLTTATPTAPPPFSARTSHTLTNEQKATLLQTLLRRSHMLADDESIPHLTWSERDQIARDLHEALALTRELFPQQQPAAPTMTAHVYSNGFHTRLRITTTDLEELIMRCGWTITEQIEGLTDAARAEIRRLQGQEYVASQFGQNDAEGARAWWTERTIDRAPCLTPDM